MSLVPVIDLGPWLAAGCPRDHDVVRAVDDACRRIGFLQFVGHPIPAEVIDAALAAGDAFFAQPYEVKTTALPPGPHINRGYAPVGAESLAYSLGIEAPPDLFEAFNVGPDVIPDEPFYRDRPEVFPANIWPGSQPALQRALADLFAADTACARLLTTLFAQALGLPDDFFVPFTDRSTDTLRFNHYQLPEGVHTPDLPDGQQGMGAHTDYGIVTVLLADPVPGLQIVGPDDQWHSVIPVEGGVLVNLGDLLAQWTNDTWKSTIHRVAPPVAPPGGGRARRRSIAFFHDGNDDALIETLPTCISPERPAHYKPVIAGDHLRAKLLGPRTATASDAVSTLGERVIS